MSDFNHGLAFQAQDECRFIVRERHYHRSSVWQRMRRKLKKAKLYFVLFFVASTGGAFASFIPSFVKESTDGFKSSLIQEHMKQMGISQSPFKGGSLPEKEEKLLQEIFAGKREDHAEAK